jgi:Transposase DNA-binding/Transposase Tn5 dimerisation domain/Transposase DDE domain
MDWFISDPRKWASLHFGTARLDDVRRTRRLVHFAADMAMDPAASIPRICEDWADTKAVYQLFARPAVTFDAVCQPHFDLRQQARGQRFLVLNDTTELGFGRHRKTKGLGPLGNGSDRGLLLHSGLLIDPDSKQLLCLAGAVLRTRVPAPKNETRCVSLLRRRETDRFGELIDQIGPPPEETEWVHVIDREGDNYEVFCHCLEQKTDAVIRARCLTRKVKLGENETETVSLTDVLANLPTRRKITLEIPHKAPTRREPERPAHTATLAVSFGVVWLPMPRNRSPYLRSQTARQIRLWVIHVWEKNPPAGQKRIEWVLYTTLPVKTQGDALAVVTYYRWRWWVEEWHKAIKTGTQIRRRQLEDAEGLKPLIGVSLVEAVRLIQMKSVSRSEPKEAAEEVVPAKYVCMLRLALQKEVKTVREFFHGVARLGGFPNRNADGEPGWQTIWHGWEKLSLMIRGAEAFHDQPDSSIFG